MNGLGPDCPEDEDGGVVVEGSDQVLGKGRDGKSGNAETPATTGAGSSRRTGSLDERIEPV
jgi:hypothetical protein